MKLPLLKVYAAKLTVFGIMLLYLVVDLYLWHGPFWQVVHGQDEVSKPSNAVAVIYGEEISPAQLERHTAEQDKLAGREEKDPARRASRLLELVRSTGLRIRARYNDLNLPDFRKEAEEEVARLASRAEHDEAFAAQLASQGYTRERFTDKLQARLKAQAQLERAIAPYCEVSDEAVAAHYEQVKDELTIPASRHVRHIFLATLHRPDDEVKGKALTILNRLQSGGDFDTLAAEASEDERTAKRGGDLGMIYQDGTFPLPELPIFDTNALPSGTPTLARSKWGWHILLAEDIRPARTATLDECRESLRSAIASAQRELAIRSYFKAAIHDARQHNRLQIHVP